MMVLLYIFFLQTIVLMEIKQKTKPDPRHHLLGALLVLLLLLDADRLVRAHQGTLPLDQQVEQRGRATAQAGGGRGRVRRLPSRFIGC